MTRDHKWPDRRAVLAGLAALGALRPAAAEDKSPIAHDALANNPLALAFETISGDPAMPDVTLVGKNGNRTFSDFLGKTLIVPLWAEWCTPCLSELPDFARLQRQYGNSNFAIVPVLTGTMKQMTPDNIAEIFGILNASVFEPLIENHLGDRLMRALAKTSDGFAVPCNVLVAPSGKVVAREIGKKTKDDLAVAPQPATADAKGENAKRAKAWQHSLWSTVYGEEFAAALADGFLVNSRL